MTVLVGGPSGSAGHTGRTERDDPNYGGIGIVGSETLKAIVDATGGRITNRSSGIISSYYEYTISCGEGKTAEGVRADAERAIRYHNVESPLNPDGRFEYRGIRDGNIVIRYIPNDK